MTWRNTLLLAVSSCLLFAACKKSGGSDNIDNSVHGTWKTTSIMRYYTAPVVNTVDMFSNLSPCMQDNLTFLRANGSFEHNEGATKCDPAAPHVIESGTFTLTNNNSMLTYSNGASMEVMEASATTLKLKFTYTGPGSEYYSVLIYARQ